jgi:uncharacterized glyoxalase superfamily protein PhnB
MGVRSSSPWRSTTSQAIFQRAIAAGARPVRAPTPDATGIKAAKVLDPFGHVWLITTSDA